MSSYLWAAQYNQAIETIDLHTTETVQDALLQLDHELFIFFTEKKTICRIVYGIGEGILRKAVLDAVKKNPLIEEWQEETDGSCLVRLYAQYR